MIHQSSPTSVTFGATGGSGMSIAEKRWDKMKTKRRKGTMKNTHREICTLVIRSETVILEFFMFTEAHLLTG